ncbi:Cytochrome C oxidase subunit II, transmembrane domain-containing protein [Strongyloides ratti]|uniref:Cytochrome C oxidase subunit II, transmembrane domain-containing protein n=1 Tax=Strongyloides ratti TaxID=34506 RepID=A0A090KW79_STRRB|nr:Cytochrome C oxidase subunit II, transmembrane domain-containing protein [Strongyloides ratti]CEF60126.1 Cytochrome C oxidase subunit II, transmembrane domain-containing protein [Strongyloides ratti]
MLENPSQKFPLQYSVSSNKSDIVLVKCPNNEYKHNETDDIFESEVSNSFMSNSAVFKTLKTEWFAISINYLFSNISLINCGKLKLKKFPQLSISWNALITWPKILNPPNNSSILDIRKKINDEWYNKSEIFVKKINRTILNVKINKEIEFYKGDRICVFNKPGNDQEILEPEKCFVTAHDLPHIDIEVSKERKIILKNNIFTKIITNNAIETFNIKLFIKENNHKNLQFYMYEKVEISTINIHYNGTYIYSPYVLSLDNTVNIHFFGIISVKYYCDTCFHNTTSAKKEIVIKNFYFGPKEKNYIKNLPDIIYSKENITFIKPNCSLNQYNFLNLHEIRFGKYNILMEQLMNNKKGMEEKFSLSNNKVFFTNESYNGIFECIYSTFGDETYTVMMKFITPTMTEQKAAKPFTTLNLIILIISIIVIIIIVVVLVVLILKYKKKKRLIREKEKLEKERRREEYRKTCKIKVTVDNCELDLDTCLREKYLKAKAAMPKK